MLGALKGVGSGIAKGAKSVFGGEGGFNWDTVADMGEGFSQGVKAVDPNSQMAGIGENLAGGIRAGSQIRANRALDRMRNAEYNRPVEIQPELPDAPLTPPPGMLDPNESALERLRRGGYHQTF